MSSVSSEKTLRDDSTPEVVTVARDDLRVVSAVISARFTEEAAEQQRLTLLDDLLRAASHLARSLSEHARHGLSESRGSHSRWNVVEDAEQVYALLVQYGTFVRQIGREYELPSTPDV